MAAELDRLTSHVNQSKHMVRKLEMVTLDLRIALTTITFSLLQAIDHHNDKHDVVMTEYNANGWSLYPESEWNACPLGCLPDGSVPKLDLPLELDFGAIPAEST